MSRSPRPSEPVALDQVADPAEALAAAYRTGGLISLATSGTTGGARRIVRTAASWVDSFPYAAALAELSPRSRFHVPGPRYASANLYGVVLGRHVGATSVDSPNDATHVFVTPAGLEHLVAMGETPASSGRRPRAVVAGDRLSPAAAERAEAAGWSVSHYYGAAQLSFVAWGRDAASLRPFPDVAVRERSGELWVRSPWVCQAEVVSPGRSPALRRDGDWAGVGDRGHLSADGRVVVGGRDEVLLCGGQTVYLSDVEATLRDQAGSAVYGEVYVIPLPHASLGAVAVAVCTDARDVAGLRDAGRCALTGAERPRRWLHCPVPPVSEGGKVDRHRLAAWAAQHGRTP